MNQGWNISSESQDRYVCSRICEGGVQQTVHKHPRLPLPFTQESSEDSEDYDPTQEEQGLPEEEDVGLSEEEEEGGEGPSSSKRPRLDPDPPPPVSSDSD